MIINDHSRRDFFKAMGIGLAALSVPGTGQRFKLSSENVLKDRPNIVLIMADDMGFSDIGCYGGEIQTPNLDRLARGGVRFTQFYNTARCCPTRASLLTGLHPHQAGVGHMEGDRGVEGYRGDLNYRCVTIAEVLKEAGYSTYMSGKWHVTKFLDGPKFNWPLQRGFDRFYGTIMGAGSFYDPDTLTLDNTRIKAPQGTYYYTDAISDYAGQFIGDHYKLNTNNPFFIYVPYTAPHWPLHAYEEDIEIYKGRYHAGWDVMRAERQKRLIEMGIIDYGWKLTERDERLPEWEKAPYKKWQARRMEVYAAQVDRMDRGIGQIISALENEGQLENTLILFLSDNGGCAEELTPGWRGRYITRITRDGRPVRRGNIPDIMPGPEDTYQSYGIPWANASNTPFRLYKHFVHEGGIATPLLVHWPAFIKSRGELRDQPGQLMDLMTTCVDVSGARYPEEYNGYKIIPMEGKSLVPAFKNEQIEREALFWEHEGNRAVRVGKWKLVVRSWQGKWELYDLEADRTETNDLSGKYPNRVRDMAALWRLWAERAKVVPYRRQ